MGILKRIKQIFKRPTCKCDGKVRHVWYKDNHRRTIRTLGYCNECGRKMYEI